jgi:DNA repair protein RadA
VAAAPELQCLPGVGPATADRLTVTNQVQSNPGSYFGDPTRPIGGNILGHESTVRPSLRQSKGTKRIVRLVDAPDLPGGKAVMCIEEGG